MQPAGRAADMAGEAGPPDGQKVQGLPPALRSNMAKLAFRMFLPHGAITRGGIRFRRGGRPQRFPGRHRTGEFGRRDFKSRGVGRIQRHMDIHRKHHRGQRSTSSKSSRTCPPPGTATWWRCSPSAASWRCRSCASWRPRENSWPTFMRGDATPATASGKTAAGEAAPHAMPAAAVRGSRSASRWNTNTNGRNDRRYASPVVRAGIPAVAAQQGPCEEQVRQYRSCQVERLPGRERRAPRLPERAANPTPPASPPPPTPA